MGTHNSLNYQTEPYHILTGGSDGLINNVPPSSSNGVPLISNGSGEQPAFGVASVEGGGTGATNFIPYTALYAGATAAGAWQSGATVGTAGAVLTSNGPNTLPSWVSPSSSSGLQINTQVFTSATATYVPSAGMVYCTIECIGAGGGGGSIGQFPNRENKGGSGGGGGGGYARKTVSAATIGTSQLVTVGRGGSGGSNGANGNTGTTSSVGSIVSAAAGSGGQGILSPGSSASFAAFAGGGGAGSSGDINSTGGGGVNGLAFVAFSNGFGGNGGCSFYGGGALGPITNIQGDSNGSNYGGGGSGDYLTDEAAFSRSGGDGSNGVVVITEFILT